MSAVHLRCCTRAGLVGTVAMSPMAIFSWDTAALLAHWPLFVMIGFCGTFGHLMLIRAFMRASAPVLAPYLYSQIAFATLGGWLIFRHVPDGLAWIGIGVIAISGVASALLSAYELAKTAALSNKTGPGAAPQMNG